MVKKLKYVLTISMLIIPMSFIGCSKDTKDINNSPNEEENYTLDNTEDLKNNEPIFSYSSIPNHIKDKMIGKSMPESEPISFDNLSYLILTYHGFDDKTYTGEMIVDKRVASEVVDIFKELYEKKYPIEKIKLIDEYNAVDEDSMTDNNSSSFCYRTIAGTNKVSNHGKGLAIDINPLQNPHVIGSNTSPKAGYVYSDRSDLKKGMIQEGDDAYNAFTKRGWSWGGHWNNPDYQHFEKQI